MKSVDRTPRNFSRRFSGLPSEDWIDHLDALELQQVSKHQWTAREFYYGMRLTLLAKAESTLQSLEMDLDRPELHTLIPEWHNAEAEDWRALVHGHKTFSMLQFGTRTAIVVVYFFGDSNALRRRWRTRISSTQPKGSQKRLKNGVSGCIG